MMSLQFQYNNTMLSIIILIFSLLSLALYFWKNKPSSTQNNTQPPQKQLFGPLNILFGSQTGIAAKLAETFAQEASEHGFEPEVIDLKDITYKHFDNQGDISIFFLANTGEGDPPDNAIKFMKVLKNKEQLHAVKNVDWSKVVFTIFGLGNTQYKLYNKTGKDADTLLEKNGAKRIYKLGLGDSNASLEDDFNQWKQQIWQVLKQFRKQHPCLNRKASSDSIHEIPSESYLQKQYVSREAPIIANYRLKFNDNHEHFELNAQDLDFKTKNSLNAIKSSVTGIKQLRQKTIDGSTLELEIQMQGAPQYKTASNIALYPTNNPTLVMEALQFFGISKDNSKREVIIEKSNEGKRFKLNFKLPNTIQKILTECIDLQGRLTKAVLKKLALMESPNKDYFLQNSSPKTTEEFKQLTQHGLHPEHHYLLKLIQKHKVTINLEDFIELSDSMAPRLFTIASCYRKSPNVTIAASLIVNGLISQHFLRSPQYFMAELRASTFTDAMLWKKVIFVAAGTGLAPFIGYLQQKECLVVEGKPAPIVSLYFGCKHEMGDFIYQKEIQKWIENKTINHFRPAFSRDSPKKVYVQHILMQQAEEIKQLAYDKQTALYMCGSLAMGRDVLQMLSNQIGEDVKRLQLQGRIIKELW